MKDLDTFERYKTDLAKIVERVHEGAEPLFGVYHLDDERKVGRQVEN